MAREHSERRERRERDERAQGRRERAERQEAKERRWWTIGVAGAVLIAFTGYASWNIISNIEEREKTRERWQRGDYTPEERARFDEILRRDRID